jgi:Cdc6-like AAA superfamily ATPase
LCHFLVHNSSFKALAGLLKTKPRGYAYAELCERFEQEIPSPAVIVLYESDMLGDKDLRRDILYFLSRSPKRYSVVQRIKVALKTSRQSLLFFRATVAATLEHRLIVLSVRHSSSSKALSQGQALRLA